MQKNILAKIDTKSYFYKPTGSEIGAIRNRLGKIAATETRFRDFVTAVELGKSYQPSQSTGNSAKDWAAQNLFCVDIDNAEEGDHLSLENIQAICHSYNVLPAGIYESFNSTVEHPKFRVIFITDEIITEENKRQDIITTLIDIFPQSDKSCKDGIRLFFGTNKKFCYVNDVARISYKHILQIKRKLQSLKEKNSNASQDISGYNNDLLSKIEQFDFLGFLKENCGEINSNNNEYIQFHSCPICGGHDDFTYYHNSKLFTCFGRNGKVSGNIIKFLCLTQNISKPVAVKYFLEEICGEKINNDCSQTVVQDDHSTEIKMFLEKFKNYKPENYSLDDKGISRLFASTVKDLYRYNVDAKCWMFYNGKYWEADKEATKVSVTLKFFTDALSQYSSMNNIEQNHYNEALNKSVKKLGGKNKRDLILKDAISELPISNANLDSSKNLINLANGTFDLDTYTLQPHCSNDLISMVANVEFNQNALTEPFTKFLNEIFENNTDKINYLQRVLGYSLTSSTKEDTMFILYGESTRNGKTTLIETLLKMLGDYGKQATPETFAVKKFVDSRAASGDLARLRCARIVNSSELPKEMVLDSAKLKTLTGGDTITVRNLYTNEFEYKPEFKIFLTTNHLPQITDDTIWQSHRVNVISFNRHFSQEEQDKNLKAKLCQKDVLSGIFNWCIEGLKAYRAEGLNPPTYVLSDNEKYQNGCDYINLFLSECFEKTDNSTKLSDVYQVYLKWNRKYNYVPEGKAKLNEKLQQRRLTGTIKGIRNMLIGYEIKDCWIG